jgi:hypothetical protein
VDLFQHFWLIQRSLSMQIRYLLVVKSEIRAITYTKIKGDVITIEYICPECEQLKKEYTQTGAIKLLDTELVL